MSRQTRVGLLVIGIALLIFSIAALIYASAPVSAVREQAPLVPTLFISPP